MKLSEIREIIFNESVCLNTAEGYALDMLKSFADFMKADCAALTVMGKFTFDSRYINYNYPSSFLMHTTNNFFYKEEVLNLFQDRINAADVVCTWSTSELEKGDFENSEIYKERYKPVGFTHGLQSTFFAEDGDMCGAIGSIRSIKKPFNEKDYKNCDELTPHMFYAYMKYRWLSGFDFYNHDGLDESCCGVLQCDNDGKVLAFNSFAEDIFKETNIDLEKGMTVPVELEVEIGKLDGISENKISDKYFYRNIDSQYGHFRFVSFKVKKGGLKKALVNKNGYLFVFSIEKVSMDYYLKLTAREKEVLSFIGSGKQDKETAYEMGVSIKTVQNHLDKIYRKLNVSNRTEATVFAFELGLNKYKIPKSKF